MCTRQVSGRNSTYRSRPVRPGFPRSTSSFSFRRPGNAVNVKTPREIKMCVFVCVCVCVWELAVPKAIGKASSGPVARHGAICDLRASERADTSFVFYGWHFYWSPEEGNEWRGEPPGFNLRTYDFAYLNPTVNYFPKTPPLRTLVRSSPDICKHLTPIADPFKFNNTVPHDKGESLRYRVYVSIISDQIVPSPFPITNTER